MSKKPSQFYLTNILGQPVTKTPAGLDITGHGFDTEEELQAFRDKHFPNNVEIAEIPVGTTTKK